MGYLEVFILGVVQGLTEFLPVSSSAHLVILQSFFPRFSQPGVLFDAFLHLGTLFAIIFYFRNEIFRLKISYIVFLILGTLPAVVVGILFSDFIESFFSNLKLVGFALLLTAIFNFYSDKFSSGGKGLDRRNSIFIGLFQALAIIPGVSRSGSTIFAGILSGVSKDESARFSFLLSVPAVLGANLLQFLKYGTGSDYNFGLYFFGFLVSFLFGILGIYLAFRFLLARNFKVFSFYCLVLGILTIFIL